jgi:uncharacterized protein (DUF885 family)
MRMRSRGDGSAFSLRNFHEAVLGEGSLPLPILAERILGTQVRLR